MKPSLAILICTLTDRKELFDRVSKELQSQASTVENEVFILKNEDSREKTTGQKRNELLEQARLLGVKVVSFVDDDDMVGPTYIKRGIEVAESGMDCGELWGQIYFNGVRGNPFHHSLIHKEWYQDEKFYYRNPNHLNFTRLDAIKDIKYQNMTIGEDGQYSLAITAAGALKTMYPIPEIIYHYFTGEPKYALELRKLWVN